MAEHLCRVPIGPVQEFIAGARRTRDLWFGSWLLSELSRTAAETIKQHGGTTTLIFPPPDALRSAEDGLASVANKILARITENPKAVGEKVRQNVEARLLSLWQEASKSFATAINQATAEQQIRDLIEVYWAGVALSSEADYPRARREVEALMAARKATRDFAPVTWGATVPKSSIDGQRESVIAEERYPKPRSLDRKEMADFLYRRFKAGPAERLSGVDLLKRHGKTSAGAQNFPSTADVAVRPFLKRLAEHPRASAEWASYLAAVRYLAAERLDDERTNNSHPVIGNHDGGLLLESRLFELLDDKNDREQARRSLNEFYRRLELPRSEPYYAILLADGDRMGATIDNQQTLESHLELSSRLGDFAQKASGIVVGHYGALIYAGGDDVLAFVPLHTLLTCASELHKAFGETLNPASKGGVFTDKDGKRPTLSMGVAICHQIEPLSDALNLAREAERAAKHVGGKDALAITLSKRSGADVMVNGKWGVLDAALNTFSDLHRMEALPDGAAFELRDLAERLAPKRGAPTLPRAATLAEAKRVIGRKQPVRGTQALADTTRDNLLNALERWASVPLSHNPGDAEAASRAAALAGVRALADAMIVARALAVAADTADLPLEES